MLESISLQFRIYYVKKKKENPNCTTTHPQEVPIDIIVQPVVDYDIPSAIVIGKRG